MSGSCHFGLVYSWFGRRQWLKWDLAGGGTLKFCVGGTEKNYSPWDNILSIVV